MTEKKGLILFVEDDRVDRMAFARYAKKNDFPYDYTLAASVEEAQTQLEQHRFDAVVLDYMLSDGTAFDLFDQVGNTPIIIVTGQGDIDTAIRAMKEGAFDFLEKDPNGNYLQILSLTIDNGIAHQQREKELQRYRQGLEELVEDRTRKLRRAVDKYKNAEEELAHAYNLQRVINQMLQRALEEISLEEYLQRSLDIILSLPNINLRGAGSIFLVDDEIQENLVMKASRGFSEQHQKACQSVPFGACVCGKAALFGTWQEVDFDDDICRLKLQGLAAHSHCAFPIHSAERLLGVISLYFEKDTQVDPEKEKSFLIITRTIARIIELFQAEEEKQVLQDQLIEAQKIESIGRLAGGIAHDFNNLLSVINGYAQLGVLDMADKGSLKEYFELIYNSGQRAADLTNQLLTFSRKTEIKPVILDLNNILDNSLKILGRLIGEDISIEVNPEPELWNVRADITQLNQVIINLAVNARDAMPLGGELTIVTKNVVFDRRYARRHLGVKAGEYVMLSVSDSGCGMTKDIQGHIFEPFFTTKDLGKGTGLGLATVYGIIKKHQGIIDVVSEPNRGSTFEIYFPAAKEDKMGGDPDATEEDELPGGTETVLLVEDEVLMRQFVARILSMRGYNILVAEDGVQALDICAQHSGKIDLLLTDVVMPQMSGDELAKKILDQWPEIKVLFMSGYTEDSLTLQNLLMQKISIIEKPLSIKKLTRKVREILNG